MQQMPVLSSVQHLNVRKRKNVCSKEKWTIDLGASGNSSSGGGGGGDGAEGEEDDRTIFCKEKNAKEREREKGENSQAG